MTLYFTSKQLLFVDNSATYTEKTEIRNHSTFCISIRFALKVLKIHLIFAQSELNYLCCFPSDGFFGKRQSKATSSQAAKRHKATRLTTVNTKWGGRSAKDEHKGLIQQCIEAKPSDDVWYVIFNVHQWL